jgi:hypothetical protein
VGRLFRFAGEHRKSLREIDTPTQAGVAPRLSALLVLFTGLSQETGKNRRLRRFLQPRMPGYHRQTCFESAVNSVRSWKVEGEEKERDDEGDGNIASRKGDLWKARRLETCTSQKCYDCVEW